MHRQVGTTNYTLAVSATNGTVTKTPNQTSYTSGQTVTLQATPNTGYTFSGWSGDLTGTANPATLTMNANKSVTANFHAADGSTARRWATRRVFTDINRMRTVVRLPYTMPEAGTVAEPQHLSREPAAVR